MPKAMLSSVLCWALQVAVLVRQIVEIDARKRTVVALALAAERQGVPGVTDRGHEAVLCTIDP